MRSFVEFLLERENISYDDYLINSGDIKGNCAIIQTIKPINLLSNMEQPVTNWIEKSLKELHFLFLASGGKYVYETYAWCVFLDTKEFMSISESALKVLDKTDTYPRATIEKLSKYLADHVSKE